MDQPRTIKDIGRLLNISASTVSRAIHDHKNISPELKHKVLELVRKLNFSPNCAAQSLRTKRTHVIGVIVPEIETYFFSQTVSGIEKYAAQFGYSIVVSQSMESFKLEKNNIQKLVSNRVDGLLISLSSETESVEHLSLINEQNIPIVLFDRISNELNVPKVVVDDMQASAGAVDYLINTGCKRIAYIGGAEKLYINKEREKGYRQALLKHDIPIRPELIVNCATLDKGVEVALSHLFELPELPDAFFCMNDPIAIQAMQILKSMKISVPDKISVIGFTNERTSNFIEPSLTTVSQPSFEIGWTAASILISQLDRPRNIRPVTDVLSTKLIIRNSTRKLVISE